MPICKNKKTWKRSIVLTCILNFPPQVSILLLQVPVVIVSPLSAAAFVSQQHGAAPSEVPLLVGLPCGDLFEPRLTGKKSEKLPFFSRDHRTVLPQPKLYGVFLSGNPLNLPYICIDWSHGFITGSKHQDTRWFRSSKASKSCCSCLFASKRSLLRKASAYMRRPAARASAAEATVTSAFVLGAFLRGHQIIWNQSFSKKTKWKTRYITIYNLFLSQFFGPIFFVPFVGESTKKNKHLHNSQSFFEKKKRNKNLCLHCPKETVRPCKALAFFCSVSSAKAWRSWGGLHPWKSGWMGKSPLGDTDGKPHNLEKIVYLYPTNNISNKKL